MTYVFSKKKLLSNINTVPKTKYFMSKTDRLSSTIRLILTIGLSIGLMSPQFAAASDAKFESETKQEKKSEIKLDSPPLLEELLYEAKISAPAPVDGPDDQSKLLQEAFKDMLVRASGSEKILKHATIMKALTEVDTYVMQFGFQINAKQERVLHVRFDESLCRTLLKNAGHAPLAVNRPPVVLWLAMQQDNVTQWVSRETQNELSHQLESLANKRGLSLVYPLLDITDTTIVSEQQVWNEDLHALQTASKRYNADNILIGKLSKQPSGWYAQWTYVKQGNSIRWDMSNTELAAVFGEALDEFSNQFSASEAQMAKVGVSENKAVIVGEKGSDLASEEVTVDLTINSGQPNQNISNASSSLTTQSKTLRLVVVGVSGGEQYAKVLKYLKSLPAVKNVEVAEVTPEQTIFNIDTNASRETIKSSIAGGQLLTENNIENAGTLTSDTDMNASPNGVLILNYNLVE